jgi:hypothetical protein
MANVSTMATRQFAPKGDDNIGVAEGNTGNLVAMYAAQSLEPTFELPLPDPENGRHGIFTFTLANILASAEGDMTFSELAEHIQTFYLANGLYQPTPMIEGTALQRSVFSKKEMLGRPSLLLAQQLSLTTFGLRAGALHGITKNTILEVYPPPGTKESDTSLGYVKVIRVQPFTAVVRPTAFNEKPVPFLGKLGYGCRCEIAYQPQGATGLKLAVQEKTNNEIRTLASGKAPKSLEDELAGILKTQPDQFTRVETNANWFLRIEDNDLLLIPASGWSAKHAGTTPESPAPPAFQVATIKDGNLQDPQIATALTRISKARQLLSIAGTSELKKSRAGSTDIKIELLKYADGGMGKATVVTNDGKGRTLESGDVVAFRITNPSRHAVDVTLLFLDSSFGITAIFPEPGTLDDNRLAPGQVFTTAPMEVNVDTIGLEQVIAIAIRASRERQDFSCLEQPTLERIRGDRRLDSPLGQLLKSTMYGSGSTRGLGPSEIDAFKLRLLSWHTQK